MSSDCNSPPCDDANGSIYIETLDRSDFFVAFLKFGIPCIICWFIGGWAFRKAQFKIKLLPSVISALTFRNWLSDDKTLEKSVGWLSLFISIVALLPSLFILLWGIYVYKNINKLLGFALFLLLMSFQMVTYGFAHWRVNGWRKDRLILVLFTASLLAMWAFEIWTIYLEQPFKYFMLSVVYVSFNMIPMTILTYMVAQSMTKPVEGYLLLSNDPVEEYKKYLKETLDAQRVKIENQDKLPIGPCGPVVQPASSASSSAVSGASVKFHLNTDAAPPNADAPVSEQKVDVPEPGVADVVSPVNNNSDKLAVGIKDAEKYNPPLWKKLGCYLLAVAILLAYSISVNKAKQADGFGNVVGWITSGTILALDLTVWLCVFGGKITSALNACLYQGAGRIILVVFGDVYWFIGHSMMYVFLAVFFGSAMVNHLAPKLNATQQKASAISDLLTPSANPETSTTEVVAMRNSDELGAGFMRDGWFARSRLGKSILNNVEFYAFSLLTFFFLIDLIVCSKTSTVDLQLSQNHAQYLAGILALFLTFVCLSSQLVYRMYYNRDYRIDADMILGCVIQWLVCIGCGVFLYVPTRSVILICFFCFLPPIVYLATYAYTEWVKNDFQLYVDGKPVAPGAGGRRRVDRAPASDQHFIPANTEEGKVDAVVLVQPAPTPSPNSPDPSPSPVAPGDATPAAVPMRMPNVREINVDLGKYNSWKKYKISVTALMSMILVIGMGSTIAAHSDPPYVGYSIAAVILILASTIIPMVEWFNSFEVSKNMITQLVITTVFFIAFILIFWIQGLHKENNNESLALLFVLFMYPTLVTLSFALLKWRDDKWVMSRFVKLALVACCVLITTFFIVVAVVYQPYQIGAGLLVCFMVLLFGSFIVPILVKRFPWLIKWSIIGGICVLIAFAAGVGSQKNTGFIGFSLGWGILFLVLLVSTYQLHRNTSPTALFSHMYSPNLFPVFAYDFTPGVQNPLRPDNKRVYFVLLTIFTAVVWGVLAVFFLQTTWIGLGVHAISIVLLVIYGFECSSQSRVMLAKAVRYLGEGSEQYEKAVHSAKLAAFRSQLVSIKGVNLTADGLSAQVAPVSPREGKSADGQPEEGKSPSPDHAVISMPSPSSVNSLADDAYDESLYLEEKDLKDLGLDSPDSRLTEIDYQSLYKLFNELRALTPIPSFTAFLKGDKAEVAKVTWRNNTLVRRRCYELLLKLDRQIATQYSNFLAYSTQVQMELILAVNAIKRDHETEILTMLRDTGHAHLDINYVQSLKPNDPERLALEAALKDWKAKQDLIVIERARKRKEEEERARIREEEDRKRYLEEQEIIIRKRQEEMKVNEVDVRRKEEERQRLEQEAQLQHQLDDQRRAEAARLEAERIAREKAEAERKQREEAEAARLISEQNERQLQVLRAQQEAARIAEEKRKEEERLTMERLKAEQAARDAALAAERQAQAALQAKIQAAYQKQCCTFNETGEKFVPQQWYQCENCNMGICEVCRSVCHSGHKLKDMGSSAFYCDCGKTGCEAATGIKPGMKGKPTLAQIEAQFAVSGVPWTDPDFPPTKKSLFRDGVGAKKTEWKDLQWKRPEEVRNFKDPKMFVNGADPLDINQGQIGDCWFMSAISVMTQRQQDFMNIFVTKEHSKAGVYSVNFYKNGERVNVLIDSNFPVLKNSSLAFGHSRESDELWVSVLEKAFAKLNNSYESIEAGFVDQALVDLSGGIGLRIDFTKDPYKQQVKSGVLFNQLLQFHENGYLLGAGSPAGSDSEANASSSGIVQGHAYAILQVAEVDGIQLLRLRNPWGRKEWTGDYSDDSAKWTRRLKSKLNWVSADDGAFWMCMADFVRNFEEAYVARFFSPDKGWECLPAIRGEWKGATAGGCTNYDTVKDNPQYLLTVSQPTTVLLNLSQTDTRGTGEKLKPIAIEVYNNKGVRITRTRTGPLICSNPESYIFRREISVEQVLQPQKEPYTILLSTFNQGEETKFSFTVYANAKVTIAEAPAIVAKKK